MSHVSFLKFTIKQKQVLRLSCHFFFVKLCSLVYQAGFVKGDDEIAKLRQLEQISALLICQSLQNVDNPMVGCGGEADCDDNNICCICYAAKSDAQFSPCSHVSCFGCVSRQLLNCQRCFFCNATITEVIRTGENAP